MREMNLITYALKNKLVLKGNHIITQSKFPSKQVREIFTLMYGELPPKVKIRKMCAERTCVNPDCYRLSIGLPKEYWEREEIYDLEKEIDFAELKFLGLENYLEKFNNGLPTGLQITSEKLKQVELYHEIHTNKDSRILGYF